MPPRFRTPRLALFLLLSALASAQTPALTNGDITVRLTQGIDSANGRPLQIAQGTVINSTTSDVPRGTAAMVQLSPEAAGGGFTVHLAALNLGGRLIRTGSSNPILTTVSKIFGRLQQPIGAAAHATVSGPHVYLPPNTEVRFTLAAPPALPPPPSAVARAPQPPAQPEPPPAPTGPPPPITAAGVTLQPSRQPDSDCRWIPYVSRKYHLAFPVEQCTGSTASANAIYTDTKDGIAFRSTETGQKDMTFIHVYTKTAAEPISSAILRVARPSLKPAARLACHPTLDKEASASGPAELYRFSATVGPLAKKEKNADFTDDAPCGQFEDYDSAPYFVYIPSKLKTTFFFANFGQEPPPWDLSSVVFLPADSAAQAQ